MRTQNYPIIVKFKEKHDDSLYIANNDEDLLMIYAAVIKERYESGYYYRTVEEVKHENNSANKELKKKVLGKYAELTDEEINNLPEVIAIEVQKAFDTYEEKVKRNLLYQKRDLEEAQFIELVAKSEEPHKLMTKSPRGRSFPIVEAIMQSRSGAEYEEFDLVYPSKTPSIEDFQSN